MKILLSVFYYVAAVAQFMLVKYKKKFTGISGINTRAVMCLFCGKLLRGQSIMSSVDDQIMGLKYTLRRRCFVDFCSGDAVLVNFVFRC